MWANIRQIKSNISAFNTSLLTVKILPRPYQESLPVGNVDSTRCCESFTGQMQTHHELCNAKYPNNNLGRRRGRMHSSIYLSVHTSFIHLLLPQDFWAPSGQNDAEVCWSSAPLDPHPDSFLLCSLSTGCLPLPVNLYVVFLRARERKQLIKHRNVLLL